MPEMISTRSTGFDIGVCLGLNLGPHGCARCPVELGAGPVSEGYIEALRLANERLKLRSGWCSRSTTQPRLQPTGPPKQPQPDAKSQGNLHPNNASVPSNMPLVLYKPWRSLGGGRTAAPCPLLHNRETTQLVATPYEKGTSTRRNLAKIFLGLCLFLGIFRCFSIPYDILQVGTRLRDQSIIQRAAANTCDQTQGADCQSEASWLARRNSAEDALLEISRANALAPDAFWAAARRAHINATALSFCGVAAI